MATLTSEYPNQHSDGLIQTFPCGVDIIYAGCMVGTDNTSSGYLFDLDAPAADRKFAGVALEGANNSAGNAGDLSVKVWQEGEFQFNGSFTQADVGKAAYVLTNNEVTTSPGQYGIFVGKIVRYISSTKVRVKISVQADRPASGVTQFGATQPIYVMTGQAAFTTTSTTKKIALSGVTAVISAVATPAAQPKWNEPLYAALTLTTSANEITVTRGAAGSTLTATSGLAFNYVFWVR